MPAVAAKTPAIGIAAKAGIAFRVHEYAHDPSAPSYGLEAASKLGVDAARVFDTVYVSAGRRGLEIELAPDDLLSLTGGRTAAIGRR
jgi:Cys-tRNA(Pro)/Cys-tRNA(Cys) deacylase